MNTSAFACMCKVLASSFFFAVASFFYSLYICGACPVGFFMGLGTALLIFTVSVFGGVVLYLE